MALQHWQANCATCQRSTLHVRNTYDVPHVAHLLASVFLCGLWLPVWFFHTIINEFSAGEPWRCQHCGSVPGTRAPDAPVPASVMRHLTEPPRVSAPRIVSGTAACPQCGGALMQSTEMGVAVYSCPHCKRVYGER
jgi:ribosomal protein L37AE/L43A